MTNKEEKNTSKNEGITRRAAMKRIAAGLAGVGIVAVAGMISPGQKNRFSDIVKEQYGDAAPKEPYGDAAPK